MTEEGVIKFCLGWHETASFDEAEILPLANARQRLYELRLIGADADGVGFGNISVRINSSEDFYITGTQTGSKSELGPSDFSRVRAVDLAKNALEALGPTKPSSEALTHAACYQASGAVYAVAHVHNASMWHRACSTALATPSTAEYGTPALAEAVRALVKENGLAPPQVIGLRGHTDGVLAYGKTLEQVVTCLAAWLKN